MVAITGPAVHDVETTFRERWEDPAPLSRRPDYWLADKLRGLDRSPDPLPAQQPPPPAVEGGPHAVQLLRTYPNLRQARDYPFAPGGERSVARGYTKAAKLARRLIYVEDQYFWGNEIASTFLDALVDNPDLRLVCVLPLVPDLEGSSRTAQLLGRQRAIRDLMEAAPGRVAAYGLENEQGTPIYVHAKLCIIDDTWATTGSDNFNRRSWTHDSELTAAVVDLAEGGHSPYAHTLRMRLAAEHLGRLSDVDEHDERAVREAVADCETPEGMVSAYAACAAALDAWHARGRLGPRPPGRLRHLDVPDLPRRTRVWARLPLRVLQDPDGRPRQLRRRERF
jgi:phosphatidylserine/phosphatidylglycerophosphate/cardiolipin synthase-like enzyme